MLYICIYICMCVCICIHVYMYICVYVCMYICKYLYLYICIYTHTFTYTCIQPHQKRRLHVCMCTCIETWGSGGRNSDFLPQTTTFLVLIAFNSVLPELVVLISTTNSGRTELNAVSTKKVVVFGVSTPRPPRLHVYVHTHVNIYTHT